MKKRRKNFTRWETGIMIKLHVQNGLSTNKIAKQMNSSKNTIIQHLRSKGVLRQAAGRNIEEKVAKYFQKQGFVVERQPGDSDFDLLIGEDKIDVKSSKKHSYKNAHRWLFTLQTGSKFPKNYQEYMDTFILVFLETEGTPMYSLKAKEVGVKKTISIPDPKNSTIPLKFLGFLD